MALPRIVLRGRTIILLLSGFRDKAKDAHESARAVVVSAEDNLREAAKRDPKASCLRICGRQVDRCCLSQHPQLPSLHASEATRP
jgi:hypothetical protein